MMFNVHITTRYVTLDEKELELCDIANSTGMASINWFVDCVCCSVGLVRLYGCENLNHMSRSQGSIRGS